MAEKRCAIEEPYDASHSSPGQSANFCTDNAMSTLYMFACNLEEITRFGFVDEIGRRMEDGFLIRDHDKQEAMHVQEWEAIFGIQSHP